MKSLNCLASTLLASLIASSIIPVNAQMAQAARPPEKATGQIAALTPPSRPGNLDSSDLAGWHARQGAYFKRNWGIDIVDVRRVASGEMLAFRYVVLDPEKAKALNEKTTPAYLIDEETGRKLMVPQMEKVGALRTTGTPKAGRMFWIIFENTGRVVTAGSRVDIAIGDFHAQGLTVVSPD